MCLEALGEGQTKWRGQIRHVTPGETRYFREWAKLVTYVQKMLPPPARSSTAG